MMEDPYTIRGLLSRIRNEENRRIKEVAALQFQLQKLRKRCQKTEAETKLERDKRLFKENELIHVKMALGRRDDVVTHLEKELEQYRHHHVHVDELEKAERKESEALAKLLEKDSMLFTLQSTLQNMKTSNDALKREKKVLLAKYEQLLRSEHQATEECAVLQKQIEMMKESQKSQRALYGNIHNSERDDTVQTLIALGKNLPATAEISTCHDANVSFKKDIHPSTKASHHAIYHTISSPEDEAISL